ncbi:hypothetical protein GALMADRAFT_138610 [Galerina marginata CBS 339.88]|uniref:Uncharacterized protein n=1 Tax=Galerina marginata (strain CBS 339.88) TaxID=685588 RepID=A0A067TEX5_GALM3|nr:hypothetical protein GALMADRAFT_138610 [Galerina marginata CBS 339.88]
MSFAYTGKVYTPNDLDHSSGHAFLSPAGDIFYSPNCSRQVEVPQPSHSYLFPARGVKFETFLSPRWWTKPYHFLSFVTLRPSFDGPIFSCLRDIISHIEPLEDDHERYALAPEQIKQWLQVEDSLILISHLLARAYSARVRAALKPIPPSLLGFNKSYHSHRSARLCIAASRDWFLMWMALISSRISDIETMNKADDCGDWFAVLAKEGVPQAWLSAIQASIICDFSRRCPRVGTFLNILNPEPDQPSVEWLYSWDIPVWYCPSGTGHHKLRHLQPPPHILQAATTFISKTPSLLPPPPLSPRRQPQEYSRHEYKDVLKAYLATKPWQPFFIAREQRNKEILANENEQNRQIRLGRERNPPITSAEVFVWEWSEDEVIELIRRRVHKNDRQDSIRNHSDAQCKYDAVSNVWDVCEFFGDDDPDDEDDEDDSMFDNGIENIDIDIDAESHMDLDTSQKDYESFIAERVHQSSSSLGYIMSASQASDLGPEVDSTHAPNELNVLQYLSLHFGFVPPLPLPERDPAPVDNNDWEECLMSVGLCKGKHQPQPGLSHPIMAFIHGLQGSGPKAHECDFLPDNRQYLGDSIIRKSFHKLNDSLYLLHNSVLDAKSVCGWQFAVTTLASAVYILRYITTVADISGIPSSMALARHLAEEGIPFRTFLNLDHHPSFISLDAIKVKIPRRVANYNFVPGDYETYVVHRKHLLATPRARAAILHGTIVGRLAKEHFAVESSVFGPSSAVTLHRLGYSVKAAGTTYWDDGLTNDEIAVICGMHHCFTGNGDQIAQVSWWPLPHYWESKNNMYNWGHWTEVAETWYQDRLKKIRDGDVKYGVPLSQADWRNALKKSPLWRKVATRIREMSSQQFDNQSRPL